MPTLLLIKGFRFFFYSNENNEPAHVHVTKDSAEGKIWLEPNLRIAYMNGFSTAEQRDIFNIVNANFESLKEKWYEFFNE
ncbi:MAG TPA: DUF4160 domain-containing protein [Parafilimonas sp.]|nr:DUF4160 domain-containing protein [Parafilimonas sp.]